MGSIRSVRNSTALNATLTPEQTTRTSYRDIPRSQSRSANRNCSSRQQIFIQIDRDMVIRRDTRICHPKAFADSECDSKPQFIHVPPAFSRLFDASLPSDGYQYRVYCPTNTSNQASTAVLSRTAAEHDDNAVEAADEFIVAVCLPRHDALRRAWPQSFERSCVSGGDEQGCLGERDWGRASSEAQVDNQLKSRPL